MMSDHNVLNGRENDLAPDDIEFLLQRYATDIVGFPYQTGYDAESGWGRIDAANTMSMIEWPRYRVYHSGSPATTTQTSLGNLTVILDHPINGISPGSHSANKVQVTQTYTNTFSTSTVILDSWARYSGTVGYSTLPLYLNGRPGGTYTFSITGNTATITAVTMAFQIGGQWIPASPADLRTAYSLHLYDPEFTSIDETASQWNVNAYPDPAMDVLNIHLNNEQPTRFRYEIMDASGRLVRQADLGIRTALREALPIGDLAKGAYTLRLMSTDDRIIRGFVKY